MGGAGGFNPIPIIAGIVFGQAAKGLLGSPNAQAPAGPDPEVAAARQADLQAEEQAAQARRAEDRRAEEAVLKAQLRRQQQSQRQSGGAALGEGGTLAGQSMHGAAPTQPQLKERLGQ